MTSHIHLVTVGLSLVLLGNAPATPALQADPPIPITIEPLPADWSPPASRNAALLYYGAWRDVYFFSPFAEIESEWLFDEEPLPPEMAKLLEKNQKIIEKLLRAASQPTADWGIEYEQNFDAIFSHLGGMSATARVLRGDARRLMDAGQFDAAAERIAAIYASAAHLRSDRLTSSSGQCMNLVYRANTELHRFLDRGVLTARSKATLLAAISRFDMDDPFAMRAAIKSEGTILMVWLEHEIATKGENAGRRFLEETIRVRIGPDDVQRAFTDELLGMDETAFREAVTKLRNHREVIATIWDEPDAPARLDALYQRIKDREFGPLAFVYSGYGISRAYKSNAEHRQNLIETRRRLEATPISEPATTQSPSRDP